MLHVHPAEPGAFRRLRLRPQTGRYAEQCSQPCRRLPGAQLPAPRTCRRRGRRLPLQHLLHQPHFQEKYGDEHLRLCQPAPHPGRQAAAHRYGAFHPADFRDRRLLQLQLHERSVPRSDGDVSQGLEAAEKIKVRGCYLHSFRYCSGVMENRSRNSRIK